MKLIFHKPDTSHISNEIVMLWSTKYIIGREKNKILSIH